MPRDERAPYDLGLYARLLGPDVLLTTGGGAVAGFIGLYLVVHFGMRPGGLGCKTATMAYFISMA